MTLEPSKLIETLRGATERECEAALNRLISDVQRETALECCKLRCLHCERDEPVEQTRFGSWCHPEHFCTADTIRERFLKEPVKL